MWLSGWVSYYFAWTGLWLIDYPLLLQQMVRSAFSAGVVLLHRCAFGDMHLSVPAGEHICAATMYDSVRVVQWNVRAPLEARMRRANALAAGGQV
jgi:hypothetical protein